MYYYQGALGTTCRSTSEIIVSQSECLSALEALQVSNPSIEWSGSVSDIPNGCSYRPDFSQCSDDRCIRNPDDGHWNVFTSVGVGRGDLRPICKEKVPESYTRMACHWVPNVRYSLADGTPFDWEYNTLDECFEKCNNDPNCLGFLDRFPMDNDKRCAWKNDESTLQPIAECKSDYYKKTVED
eukprot:UN25841